MPNLSQIKNNDFAASILEVTERVLIQYSVSIQSIRSEARFSAGSIIRKYSRLDPSRLAKTWTTGNLRSICRKTTRT